MFPKRRAVGEDFLALLTLRARSRHVLGLARVVQVNLGPVPWRLPVDGAFPRQNEVPSEHVHHAGDLLLLVHPVVGRHVGLEVVRHLPGNSEITNNLLI